MIGRLTNDVDLTSVGPVLAGAEGPVCGPYTAAVGHGVDVGDEETAGEGLVGGDADRLAPAAIWDAVGVVDCDDGGAVILDVGKLG